MITLLIADDHVVMRQGIRLMVEAEPDLKVVGEASQGPEAVRLCQTLHPKVLLLDIHMPHLSGIEVCRRIVKEAPGTRVLAFSHLTSEEYLRAMLEAGACGYALKADDGDTILKAIRSVGEGQTYVSPTMGTYLVQSYLRQDSQETNTLTQREQQIIRLVASGLTNSIIAQRLGLSLRTVQTHRSNAMKKLDAHNTIDLINQATRRQLLATGRPL